MRRSPPRATRSPRADDGLALVDRRVDAGYASDLDLRQAEGATHRRVGATEGAHPPARAGRAPARRADRQARSRRPARRYRAAAAARAAAAGPPLDPARTPPGRARRRAEPGRRRTRSIGVAVAQQFPTISLTGNYGGESAALALAVHRVRAASGPSASASPRRSSTPASSPRWPTPSARVTSRRSRPTSRRSRHPFAMSPTRSTTSPSSRRRKPTCRRASTSAREALRLANRRYEAGYSRLSRSARRAAHGQHQRAAADPQPPGAARCRRRPDDGARRRLAARGNDGGEVGRISPSRRPPSLGPVNAKYA